MTSYAYHYVDDQECPLLVCPFCGEDLTEEDGIDLTLSVGNHVFTIPTCLTELGELVDTEDSAVANGYHSVTECGHCGEQLGHYEAVTEAQEEREADDVPDRPQGHG